jgi:hypothetical protein
VKALEAIESAQVAGFAERTVKRRDLRRTKRSILGSLELKVWRTKQGDAGNTREVRADAREQHVNDSRVRFGRKRKRVKHLMWDTGSTKHFTCEVHVRQPLAYNECSAVENVAFRRNFIADPSRELTDLVLTIASDNAFGWDHVAELEKRQARGGGLSPHFLDSRQPPMDALVKGACERRVGHHDIDALQSGKAGKKVPVNGIQPVPIGGAIAHGDNDVPPWLIGFRREQTFADGMLVDTSSVVAASFELAEYRYQEAGLTNEPFRPSILFDAGVQPSECQTLEVAHRLVMTLQRIEKLQHGADKPGPNAKRRFRTGFACNPTGSRQERLAFLDRE